MLLNKTVVYPVDSRRRWCAGSHTKQCMRMFDAGVCVCVLITHSFNAPCHSPRTLPEWKKQHFAPGRDLAKIIFILHTVWTHLNSSFSLISSAFSPECDLNTHVVCAVSLFIWIEGNPDCHQELIRVLGKWPQPQRGPQRIMGQTLTLDDEPWLQTCQSKGSCTAK